MKLEKLTLLNFKNLDRCEIALPRRVTCLVGENGAGKTNLLDAVHYLSVGRGAMGLTDRQSVRHGEEFFMIEGSYLSPNGKRENIVCSFAPPGGKTLSRGGKEYERLSDHLGLIPLVAVLPSDVFLVSDAAEERRRYMNSLLSQLDRAYLESMIRYNNVLAQRNRLLKEPWGGHTEETLEAFDMLLCEYGQPVWERRGEAVRSMAPLVASYYAALSGDREQVELAYRSELDLTPFPQLLAECRERDRANRFSTCGIHRDDLVMRIGGLPLKKYGSQGQQKSFLVALKLAQYQSLAQASGERPILLLDDLFDKLDEGRVEGLINLVSGSDFGQIFITDCNGERLEGILDRTREPYTFIEVRDGKISPRP